MEPVSGDSDHQSGAREVRAEGSYSSRAGGCRDLRLWVKRAKGGAGCADASAVAGREARKGYDRGARKQESKGGTC